MRKAQAIAHVRKVSSEQSSYQKNCDHLSNVSNISKILSAKIGLAKAGELLGLLHDLGKYSDVFQNYIGSATGLVDQDEDEFVNPEGLKGKIDHSTSGSQYIWNFSLDKDVKNQIAAQLLALCIASHHSGLIDCITIDGDDNFNRRMAKSENKTHLAEALEKVEPEIIEQVRILLNDPECLGSVLQKLKNIALQEKSEKSLKTQFQAGLMIRMLFSCLIDADRLDTANFENPKYVKRRQNGKYISWGLLIERLEDNLKKFDNKPDKKKVDILRKLVSDKCFERSSDNLRIFTLTVPTGGGKTLASLRFAVHHAHKHKLDRIIFVIPFTSIIDQNAQIVRDVLETGIYEEGRIVLEHHSNLLPERQNWKTKILTENWDAPIIYTTSVQFLETLFSGGTSSTRRMHQLTRSVIVFDEIQTLPVKTIHLFCNAINFLTNHCNSSVVLCTATQPLLNKVSIEKGRIDFSHMNEIIPDVEKLFNDLKRVEVINKTKSEGWDIPEISQLTIEQVHECNSCLVIVNTKAKAKETYESCAQMTDVPIYHLSTSMCPAHRMSKLDEIRRMLGSEETFICVSTQLIEAGVDIDFGSVIRFVAGIDSIAQAAGRCNRNGERALGKVFVVNPKDENIDNLHDIKIGRDISNRILNEMHNPQSGLPDNLIHPSVMERYFQYYFYNRAGEMSYSVDVGRNDNLLNLLSINSISVNEYMRTNDREPKIYFRQAFGKAGEQFKAIDAPTQGIVVPYSDNGKKIIADLFSMFAVEQQYELLRKAQKFTVNAFPDVIKKLNEQKAIREVPEIGVLVLSDPRFYNPEFGLCTEPKTEYETLLIN
jgi:CRISPR-associated endonuclease/helicase Cas3